MPTSNAVLKLDKTYAIRGWQRLHTCPLKNLSRHALGIILLYYIYLEHLRTFVSLSSVLNCGGCHVVDRRLRVV